MASELVSELKNIPSFSELPPGQATPSKPESSASITPSEDIPAAKPGAVAGGGQAVSSQADSTVISKSKRITVKTDLLLHKIFCRDLLS